MAGINTPKMHKQYSLNHEVKKKLEIYMKSFIVMDIAEIWREILNVVC
jgi:hypothetical protein